MSIAAQRCHNHLKREAVSLCLECTRYFCRECVTEHDNRVICASCIRKLSTKSEKKRLNLEGLKRLALSVFGVFTLWLFFYILGFTLVSVAEPFHEDVLWEETQDEEL
jgi:hypothetical protein